MLEYTMPLALVHRFEVHINKPMLNIYNTTIVALPKVIQIWFFETKQKRGAGTPGLAGRTSYQPASTQAPLPIAASC